MTICRIEKWKKSICAISIKEGLKWEKLIIRIIYEHYENIYYFLIILLLYYNTPTCKIEEYHVCTKQNSNLHSIFKW